MIDNPFGGGIKKAPGLLKQSSHLLFNIAHPSGARPGANALCHATWVFRCLISETLQRYKIL